MKLRKLRIVAGIAAVAAVFAMAAPASSLPRYTESFDCDTDGGWYYSHALAAGTTLTVALTSCEEMPVVIDSGTVILNGIDVTHQGEFIVPGNTSRITVTPGTYLYVPEFVEMSFPEAIAATEPKGSLLGTETVAVGRKPLEFTAGTDRQIENEQTVYLDKKKECDLQSGAHVYATSTLEVTEKGTYTVRAVATDPVANELSFHPDIDHPFNDLFVAAYLNYERPWNLSSKRLAGCNDDANDWGGMPVSYATSTGYVVNPRNPWMTLTLKPGKYVLMWSTYDRVSSFNWSRGLDDYGNPFKSGNQSITYEVWGPAGGLVG